MTTTTSADTTPALPVSATDTPPAPPLLKCEDCGLTTSAPELLREKRRSFRRSARRLCVRCYADQSKLTHRLNLIWYSFYVLVGLGLSLLTGDLAPLIMMLTFLLYLVGSIFLAVLMHEAGHAIVARLVGWEVYGVFMGAGRLLWQGRIGDTLLQFRLVQAGGYTYCAPAAGKGGFRWRAFAVIAGGPLVNLLAVLAALPAFLVYKDHNFNLMESFSGIFVMVNALCLILTLIPYNVLINGAPAGTDGLQLYRLLFKPALVRQQFEYGGPMGKFATLRQLGETRKALDAARQQAARWPHDAMTQVNLSAALADEKDLPAAEGAAQQGLDLIRADAPLHPAVPPALVPIVKKVAETMAKNNLAFFKLKLRGATPEAVALAEEAWKLMPWESAVQGTYGYALALNGSREEGLAMMKEAAKRNRDYPPQTKKELAEMIEEFERTTVP